MPELPDVVVYLFDAALCQESTVCLAGEVKTNADGAYAFAAAAGTYYVLVPQAADDDLGLDRDRR